MSAVYCGGEMFCDMTFCVHESHQKNKELSIFTTKVCIVSVVWTYTWGIDSYIIKCENNIPTMQPYTGISRRTIGFGFIIDNNV